MLALGPDGLVVTDDRGRWSVVEGAPEGVADLVDLGARVLAATATGGWVTSDAVAWTPWTWPERSGVGTVVGGGQVGDLLLAAGAEGVAVSVDAGVTWSRLADGPEVASPRAVAVVEGRALMASASGLFRLGPPRTGRELARGPGDGLPSLSDLRVAAESRVGLAAAAGARGPGVQVAGWLLPQVSAQLRWVQGADDASSLDAGLEAGRAGNWQLQVWATWRPPGRKVVASDPQDLVVVERAEDQGAFAGGFDQWMMLGSAGREATAHRLEVAERLVGLIVRRERLMGERGRDGQPLREVVARELRIAEIDAELDALTDGAVTRYRSGRTGRGGGG
jgi:hypothetical protein